MDQLLQRNHQNMKRKGVQGLISTSPAIIPTEFIIQKSSLRMFDHRPNRTDGAVRNGAGFTSPEARKRDQNVIKTINNGVSKQKKSKDGQPKVKQNGLYSVHKPSKQSQKLLQTSLNTHAKMEKDRSQNPKPKKPSKTLPRAYSQDKLKVRRPLCNKYAPTEAYNEQDSGFDEYFLFDNRIIPIINSDEKRVVNRYFNDSVSTQDKDWKHMDSTGDTIHKKVLKDEEVMTEIQSEDQSVQTNIKAECKTQQTATDPIVTPPLPKKEKEELKFDEFLTKLEFLYLPEERHFQQLTSIEKAHYRDLFMMIAQKLMPRSPSQKKQEGKEMMSIEKSALMFHQISQQIAMEIQQRIAQQMSCSEMPTEEGIPTNLLSILSYLSNLFCFIELQYKQQLLKGINMPYGYYNNERFYMLTHGNILTRNQRVLSDEVYYEFQKEFFMTEGEDPQILEAIHMHNKVIFDCLNQQLNIFRPFYSCKGEPYLWFTPGKITFFSIGQDDVELVLEKAKVKILQTASFLCGIHCQHKSLKQKDPDGSAIETLVLKDVRQERERKMIVCDIQQIDESVEIEDYRTALALEFSDIVFEILLSEETRELLPLLR